MEYIDRTYAEQPGLNTEYKVLSNYGGELDIGFIARKNENPPYGEIDERIRLPKR